MSPETQTGFGSLDSHRGGARPSRALGTGVFSSQHVLASLQLHFPSLGHLGWPALCPPEPARRKDTPGMWPSWNPSLSNLEDHDLCCWDLSPCLESQGFVLCVAKYQAGISALPVASSTSLAWTHKNTRTENHLSMYHLCHLNPSP